MKCAVYQYNGVRLNNGYANGPDLIAEKFENCE